MIVAQQDKLMDEGNQLPKPGVESDKSQCHLKLAGPVHGLPKSSVEHRGHGLQVQHLFKELIPFKWGRGSQDLFDWQEQIRPQLNFLL